MYVEKSRGIQNTYCNRPPSDLPPTRRLPMTVDNTHLCGQKQPSTTVRATAEASVLSISYWYWCIKTLPFIQLNRIIHFLSDHISHPSLIICLLDCRQAAQKIQQKYTKLWKSSSLIYEQIVILDWLTMRDIFLARFASLYGIVSTIFRCLVAIHCLSHI